MYFASPEKLYSNEFRDVPQNVGKSLRMCFKMLFVEDRLDDIGIARSIHFLAYDWRLDDNAQVVVCSILDEEVGICAVV